jgi:hypothetical protein
LNGEERSVDTQYLRDQLSNARLEAAATNLPNVRYRFLESAAAWEKLVERAERLEELSSLPLWSS